ncbi:MAG TPA: DMT family transporter [Acidimicrobiales bacterium]|nr:DMT family transporter [Acidimicrobiales bacterium]
MHPAMVVRLEVIGLSAASALLLAITSVLQQRAACQVPHHKSMRPGLVTELLRRPLWVMGVLTDIGAYLLQFLALRRGSLLVVQSILVTGLLFALPLGAAASRRRLSRQDWLGTVAVVCGLVVFLATAEPTRGNTHPGATGWALLLGLIGTSVAALVLLAPSAPGKQRAIFLGSACGILFGLNAALTKACAGLLDHGVERLILSWQLWVLVGAASYGFLLSQSAFQAGPLEASLPVLTISDPLISAAIGLGFFHEAIADRPGALLVEVAGAATMVVGVFLLARSPLVLEDAPGPGPGPPATSTAEDPA